MVVRAERVVVLSFWDPWEAPHGGTLRTRAFCEAFARSGAKVTCVYPAAPSSVGGLFDGVERLPVQGQTAGHQRWPPLLQRLKRTLLPLPTQTGARSPSIEAALRGLDVDLLVVSHLTAVQYRNAVPGAQVWLDQSDLWSDFARREVGQRRGVPRVTADLQRRLITRREDEVVRSAAVVTAAGWSDQQTLQTRTGVDVHWLPTAVPEASRETGGGPARRAAGYLANFAYHPNVDALEVLLEHWLPALRSHGWELVVAGLESDRMTVPDDVVVLGPLDDIADFYARIDCTLAPVRLGGGMKVKVIESLLRGVPALASSFALDGFPPGIRDAAHVVALEDPDLSFLPELDRAVDLSDDVRRRFSASGFADTVAGIVAGD